MVKLGILFSDRKFMITLNCLMKKALLSRFHLSFHASKFCVDFKAWLTLYNMSSSTVDYEQFLFPLGNSRAKRTRERARKSPVAWKFDACVYITCSTRACRVSTRHAIFALAHVCFSLDYPRVEWETARSLSVIKYHLMEFCFRLDRKCLQLVAINEHSLRVLFL